MGMRSMKLPGNTSEAYITIAIRASLELNSSMIRTLFEKCIRARFDTIRERFDKVGGG